MRRFLNLGVVAIVSLLALLAVTGFAFAQSAPVTTTTSSGAAAMSSPSTGTSTTAPLPALQGIPPQQLFSHFQGGQFTVTDNNGATVTYVITAGTVDSVTANSITVTPNHGTNASAAPMTFNITSNTLVRSGVTRGSLQPFAKGDDVIVISQSGTAAAAGSATTSSSTSTSGASAAAGATNALVVAKVSPQAMRYGGPGQYGGSMGGFGGGFGGGY